MARGSFRGNSLFLPPRCVVAQDTNIGRVCVAFPKTFSIPASTNNALVLPRAPRPAIDHNNPASIALHCTASTEQSRPSLACRRDPGSLSSVLLRCQPMTQRCEAWCPCLTLKTAPIPARHHHSAFIQMLISLPETLLQSRKCREQTAAALQAHSSTHTHVVIVSVSTECQSAAMGMSANRRISNIDRLIPNLPDNHRYHPDRKNAREKNSMDPRLVRNACTSCASENPQSRAYCGPDHLVYPLSLVLVQSSWHFSNHRLCYIAGRLKLRLFYYRSHLVSI